MPGLESQFASWRETLQQAGIGPGAVRDELEGHLRDAVDELMRSGRSEEVAFTEAVTRLGPAIELKRQYDLAVPLSSRVWKFVRQPIGVFPKDMRFCAWGALVLGLRYMIVGLRKTFDDRLITMLLTTDDGILLVALSCALPLVVGLLGFVASCSYLGRRQRAAAYALATFWSVMLGGYAFYLTMVPGYFVRRYWSSVGPFAVVVTLMFMLAVNLLWIRRLRSPNSAAPVE